MVVKFRGQVTLANGAPLGEHVSNIQVRVFDHDPGPNNDDELTLEPAVPDARGRFNLKLMPSRYLDLDEVSHTAGVDLQFDEANWTPNPMFDLPQPYIFINYQFQDRPRTFTAPLRPFQRSYQLPHLPPVEFIPSVHGFNFINSFPPFDPPFSLPDWLKKVKVGSNYGLCGGMSSAAYDLALAGQPVPERSEPPKTGTRLHRYLIKRSVDTFGLAGVHLAKVARWSQRPEEGTFGTHRLSMDELPKILEQLDDRQLVVIAQVRSFATNYKELSRLIWDNHQVLAVSYTQPSPDEYVIQIYDPNFRNRDDVFLRIRRYQVGQLKSPNGEVSPIYGAHCQQSGPGNLSRNVRGFFPMHYTPVKPPKSL
jgi:hypothetical protein